MKTVSSLRPSLMQSQLLLKTAPFEPPWFGNCHIQLSKWAPLYGKLEIVATRVAVLESLLESKPACMDLAWIDERHCRLRCRACHRSIALEQIFCL